MKNEEDHCHNNSNDELNELKQLFKELDISSIQNDDSVNTSSLPSSSMLSSTSSSTTTSLLRPLLTFGFGSAVLINIGILCSIPPVLRGRGAPYLPILEKNMKHMFQQLRNEPKFMSQYHQVVRMNQQERQQHSSRNSNNNSNYNDETNNGNTCSNTTPTNKLIFVDLGSGDGRIVFHAEQEQLFTHCYGYEINPFLYFYSLIRQYIRSSIQQLRSLIHNNNKIFSLSTNTSASSSSSSLSISPDIGPICTQFYLRDLWNVDLQNVNVVAVYGLGPIMKELGRKLQRELPSGSYILSNVFPFPGWKPLPSRTIISNSNGSLTGNHANTYIYLTPDCWEQNGSIEENADKKLTS